MPCADNWSVACRQPALAPTLEAQGDARESIQ